MKYWIYILKSINYEKTYIGMTNNLQRRLDEHNNGKSIYTSKFRPWEILYTEEVKDLNDARIREKYYKSAAGRRKIKKILDDIRPGSSVGYPPDSHFKLSPGEAGPPDSHLSE